MDKKVLGSSHFYFILLHLNKVGEINITNYAKVKQKNQSSVINSHRVFNMVIKTVRPSPSELRDTLLIFE